jgi:VIT1/CCC1 family predicted Fe2+/Mn2+ transporter
LLLAEDHDNELRSGAFTAVAYLVGALPPLIPYFFATSSLTALVLAVIFAGLALTAVATVISLFSGIALGKKALEMVASAFFAAALSYGFGTLLQHFTGVNA